MGKGDQSTLKSDSGYGDDASVSSHTSTQNHPLSRKGYEIGPASSLQVGDVFEFLWTDAPEFEWEWKCLGYTKFIVLRHSETFPHHCFCIPISVGTKHDFAKPGIDYLQQGFVFANGDRNPGCEQPGGGPKLPYSPVGIELRPGRLRIKEDSRANYADQVEVDGDAQVMVVGDVAMYFDRVRRNVNRASMRQTLRKALEEYRKNGKVGLGGNNNNGGTAAAASSSVNLPYDNAAPAMSSATLPMINEATGSFIMPIDRKGSATPSIAGGALLADRSDSEGEPVEERAVSPTKGASRERPSRERRDRADRELHREHSHRRRHSQQQQQINSRPSSVFESSRPMRGATGPGACPPLAAPAAPDAAAAAGKADYDIRSMHNVALAGLK